MIYNDASENGLGCVLMYKDKVISHASWQAQILREKLPYPWLRVGSSSVCAENIEILPIWSTVQDLHWPSKSKVHIYPKGAQLKKRQWLKLLKDYDLKIQHHPGKANEMADALNKKIQHSLNTIIITQTCVLRDLEWLGVKLMTKGRTNTLLSSLEVQPSLIEEIKLCLKWWCQIIHNQQKSWERKSPRFIIHDDGTPRLHNRSGVSNKDDELK